MLPKTGLTREGEGKGSRGGDKVETQLLPILCDIMTISFSLPPLSFFIFLNIIILIFFFIILSTDGTILENIRLILVNVIIIINKLYIQI